MASIELWFVMAFLPHEARAFDPVVSSMAVFNDMNNSRARSCAPLASFPGECVVGLMCS